MTAPDCVDRISVRLIPPIVRRKQPANRFPRDALKLTGHDPQLRSRLAVGVRKDSVGAADSRDSILPRPWLAELIAAEVVLHLRLALAQRPQERSGDRMRVDGDVDLV